MFNSVLTTLLAYPKYVSLGALVMSVFFAGTMLQGEWNRKKEIKAEMREIRAEADAVLQEVDAISSRLKAQDEALVFEIKQTYKELEALNHKEWQQRVALDESEAERRRLESELQQPRRQVKSSSGFIIDNN